MNLSLDSTLPKSVSEPTRFLSNFDNVRGILTVVQTDIESLKTEQERLNREMDKRNREMAMVQEKHSREMAIVQKDLNELQMKMVKLEGALNLRQLCLEIELKIKEQLIDAAKPLFPDMITSYGGKKMKLVKNTPLSYFLEKVDESQEMQQVLLLWTDNIRNIDLILV